MKSKKLFISILMTILLISGSSAIFAAERPRKGLINPEDEKEIKGYTINAKQLLKEAEENLKKVRKDLREKKKEERNKEKEILIKEHVEKGNAFYGEGRLKKAEEEWRIALEIGQDPDMKDYVRENVRRVRQEDLLKSRASKERLLKIEEERRKTAEMVSRLEKMYKGVKGEAPAALKKEPLPATISKIESLPFPIAAKIHEPKKALKKAPVESKIGYQSDIFPEQNIPQIIVTIFILFIFLVILNISDRSKSASAKKRKDFEPRDLRKYLNDKDKGADRDLFE